MYPAVDVDAFLAFVRNHVVGYGQHLHVSSLVAFSDGVYLDPVSVLPLVHHLFQMGIGIRDAVGNPYGIPVILLLCSKSCNHLCLRIKSDPFLVVVAVKRSPRVSVYELHGYGSSLYSGHQKIKPPGTWFQKRVNRIVRVFGAGYQILQIGSENVAAVCQFSLSKASTLKVREELDL